MAATHDTCPWGPSPPESPTEFKKNGKGPSPSTVQDLLYGREADKPVTPIKGGKKSVHSVTVRPTPFAEWDVKASEVYTQNYHKKKQASKGAIEDTTQYKVGGGGFDPSYYRANIESNYNNTRIQRTRNHGEGGLLCHAGQEAPGGTPTASGEKVGYGIYVPKGMKAPVVVDAAPDE